MEKTEMKQFSTKAIVIAAIILVVSTLWYSADSLLHHAGWLWMRIGEWPAQNNIDYQNAYYYATVLLFGTMAVVVLIIALVNAVSKKPLFSRQEVAIITLVIPIASLTLFQHATHERGGLMSLIALPFGIYASRWDTATLYPLISPLLGPQDTAVYDAMLPVGSTVNWGAWLPSLSWGLLYLLSPIFTMLFVSLLVQKVWIHDERITFPMATLQNEMIELTQKSETGKSKLLNKYLLIGLIIGLVWMVPTYLKHWWVPGVSISNLAGTLWYGGPYAVAFWAGGKQIEQILPWSTLWINLMPYAIGWGFLNTIPNLVGAVLTGFIIFLMVPLVMYNMGLLTSPASHNVGPHIQVNQWEWGGQGFGGAGAIPVGLLLAIGMILGVVVYTGWRNRKQYAAPLLALFRKPSPEAEKNSPLSYQLIWIGLIISFIAWVASGVAINISISAWLLWLIIVIVMSIGSVRLLSETGGYFGSPIFQVHLRTSIYTLLGQAVIAWTGTYGDINITTIATVMSLSIWGLLFAGPVWGAIRGGWLTAHTFKVASDLKMDLKKVLKLVVALIVACFGIGFIFNLALTNYLPLSIPATTSYQNAFTYLSPVFDRAIKRYAIPGGYKQPQELYQACVTDPAYIPWTLLPLLIGFAVIVVAYFLRGRFSWFIIGPAGIAMGAIVGHSIWASWLVALVIKYLVIKVGGMKLYNEKAQPFFIGSLLAFFLIIFLGDIGAAIVLWPTMSGM